ncbi:glycosyltransferase family 4 protein, partial [Candidatus Uhrbacteria bacterium]|nr:glycosyltransferase family 4 protein [Candidatus Uhrbacteria bacterium]
MTHTPKRTIAVFFTHGVSLELWDQRGMFSREVRFYEELAAHVGEVWFFTYGRNDSRYADRLGHYIRIFPKQLPVPNLLYGILLPFLYWRTLKHADIIRIHQVAGAIPALIAHVLLHKPLIVRAGFQWYSFARRQGASRLKLAVISLIERLAYTSAHAIIHTTRQDADFVADRYGVDASKLHIIPNWVDTDLFKPMDIKKVPKTICFVGRLEKQKNLHALVEAMQGLGARLIVYGEGSLRESLEQQARGLHVNVEFRGRIANENLPTALNACEIFILPSLYEGNPKVLLEAMACGLPVIGTNVEGIREII